MLKTLYEEIGAAPAADPDSRRPRPAHRLPRLPRVRPGRSRDNPVEATFLSRTRLNKPGSEKETWHVEFDLSGSGLDYAVGDTLRHFPDQRSRARRCRDRDARRPGGLPDRGPAPCATF